MSFEERKVRNGEEVGLKSWEKRAWLAIPKPNETATK